MLKAKKIYIVCSLIFLIIFINYYHIVNIVNPNIMSVKIIKKEEINKLKKEYLEKKPQSHILYNNAPIIYDESTNTIYISQNMYKDAWEGKLKVNKGELFIEEDELLKDKKNALKEGKTFRLLWREREQFWVYNLVFTGMPIISLRADDGENKNLEIWNGTIEVYDPYRKSMEYQNYQCVYNVRGGSTKGFPKKGYKVELVNNKASILGMREDDDWILNALYDDAGLVHNKISMEVWNEITKYNSVKKDNGYAIEYTELFLNGKYHGVYLIGERVDEKELELTQKDFLYKCRAMRIPEEHNYTNEVTDGLDPIFRLKYPKEDISENWEPLKKWVDCFLKLKNNEYDKAVELLNLENAIDYNLFCLLIGGGDNTRKNSFLVADYQEDGRYQMIKIPWDLNATWGNPWTGNEETNNTTYTENYFKEVMDWSSDISSLYYMNEQEVSSLLYKRWLELRQNYVITEEKIIEMLDMQFTYLHDSGAYHRNYTKWPEGSECWSDSNIYHYVENRIPFLDEYFEGLYDTNVNGAFYKGVNYSDEFEARWYWEAYYDILSEIYEYDKDVLLQHYVHYGKPYGMKGRPSEWSEIPVRRE